MPGFRPARRTAGVGRGRRQPTNWARTVASGLTVLPASSKVLLASVVLSNPGINETIRRTRGIVLVTSDQGSIQEEQLGAVGAMLVTDTAVGAGVASLPDPVTDANDDGWFVWLPFMQISGAQVTAGTASQTAMNRYEFDSKAMRRMEEGYQVAFVAANASATRGLSIAITISLLSSLS